MLEKSYAADAADGGTLTLYGSTFVARKWGNITNAAFRYRLTVGAVKDGRQLVRIYFTPLPATHAKEFLAMQYIYTRSHR